MLRRNFIRFFEAKSYDQLAGSNPLFRRQTHLRTNWVWLAGGLVGASLIAAGVFIVYGSHFRLTTVQVHGAAMLSDEHLRDSVQGQLSKNRLLILPNHHKWLFNISEAEATLIKDFPLQSVDIQTSGSIVNVTVVEDVFMLMLKSGDQIFLLDTAGNILRTADQTEKAEIVNNTGAYADMPVLRESISVDHAIGEQLFSDEILRNVISFYAGLKAYNLQVLEFMTDDITLPWFTVSLDRDYVVLFDATQNVDTQLTVLKTVIDDRFTNTEQPRYIDVRFGNRVYVR